MIVLFKICNFNIFIQNPILKRNNIKVVLEILKTMKI